MISMSQVWIGVSNSTSSEQEFLVVITSVLRFELSTAVAHVRQTIVRTTRITICAARPVAHAYCSGPSRPRLKSVP